MGENTHQNCTRQNKNKEDPGRQQPCWGFLFCTNLTQPTGALDSNTGKQVFDTLKKLSEEKLVIVVSHDREFAEQYGDRIIELADGKVISDVEKTDGGEIDFSQGISFEEDGFIISEGYHLTEEDRIAINEYMDSAKKRC